MRFSRWKESNAVFFPEVDDEHRTLFQAIGEFQKALESDSGGVELPKALQILVTCAEDHFTHEEKLMRGLGYQLFDWHKKQHDSMRKHMKHYAPQIAAGDAEAGAMLIECFTTWLNDHVAVSDQMMAAFLRNQQRGRIA